MPSQTRPELVGKGNFLLFWVPVLYRGDFREWQRRISLSWYPSLREKPPSRPNPPLKPNPSPTPSEIITVITSHLQKVQPVNMMVLVVPQRPIQLLRLHRIKMEVELDCGFRQAQAELEKLRADMLIQGVVHVMLQHVELPAGRQNLIQKPRIKRHVAWVVYVLAVEAEEGSKRRGKDGWC